MFAGGGGIGTASVQRFHMAGLIRVLKFRSTLALEHHFRAGHGAAGLPTEMASVRAFVCQTLAATASRAEPDSGTAVLSPSSRRHWPPPRVQRESAAEAVVSPPRLCELSAEAGVPPPRGQRETAAAEAEAAEAEAVGPPRARESGCRSPSSRTWAPRRRSLSSRSRLPPPRACLAPLPLVCWVPPPRVCLVPPPRA